MTQRTSHRYLTYLASILHVFITGIIVVFLFYTQFWERLTATEYELDFNTRVVLKRFNCSLIRDAELRTACFLRVPRQNDI